MHINKTVFGNTIVRDTIIPSPISGDAPHWQHPLSALHHWQRTLSAAPLLMMPLYADLSSVKKHYFAAAGGAFIVLAHWSGFDGSMCGGQRVSSSRFNCLILEWKRIDNGDRVQIDHNGIGFFPFVGSAHVDDGFQPEGIFDRQTALQAVWSGGGMAARDTFCWIGTYWVDTV